jgi:polar amino acid transport system substrate-binding protein
MADGGMYPNHPNPEEEFMKVSVLFRLALASALAILCSTARAQTEVTVYTYNHQAPFIIDPAKKDGLEFRLCEWLNKESKGAYHFTLKLIPGTEAKARAAKDDFDGLLFDINSKWVSEATRAKVLWTPAILFDRQLVVSMGAKKVEYAGPASLTGHSFLGVKSYFYPAITDQVTAGKITRTDTASEAESLRMLAGGKADFTIVSEWSLMYEQLRNGLEGDFYTATKPIEEVERYILVPASMKAVHEHLGKLLKDVKKNPGWQEATSL